MSTLGLPQRQRLTHLQRAYKVFERMPGQYLSGRALAALMQCEVPTAYNYIKRLKDAKCIEVKGGTGRVPTYGLVEGAKMPPDDARGGKRARRPLLPDFLGRGGESEEIELAGAMVCSSGKES